MNPEILTDGDVILVAAIKELLTACDDFTANPSPLNEHKYDLAVNRLAIIEEAVNSVRNANEKSNSLETDIRRFVSQYKLDRKLDSGSQNTLGILVLNAWTYGNSSIDNIDPITEDALDEYIHMAPYKD